MGAVYLQTAGTVPFHTRLVVGTLRLGHASLDDRPVRLHGTRAPLVGVVRTLKGGKPSLYGDNLLLSQTDKEWSLKARSSLAILVE